MTDINRAAEVIARALGDDIDNTFNSKAEWTQARGEKGGRFRDINEPMRDDYLAAAQALADAGMLAGGWRPIAEAPKMRHVLLWFPKGEHVIALVNGPDHYEAVGYLGDDSPTHFMPLPQPPAEG